MEELPAEKTVAFAEGAPAAAPGSRQGALSKPSGSGVRLGPDADRFFSANEVPPDPFAPVGQAPAAPAVAHPPGHDPFMVQPPPVEPGTDLGKPKPLRWVALGAGVLVALMGLGMLLAFILSGAGATSLEIISVPEGATVQVGGEAVAGVTPVTIEELAPGQNISIEIRHAGYEPHRADFDLTEGENRRVFLLNQIRATLHIETQPPGGQIWVDDELRGTAPIDINSLPAGRTVSLRASAPEHGEVRRQVTISENDREPRIVLELPPAQ